MVTSTTATPTPATATAATAASASQTAAQTLLKSLGSGSGIDTAALIPSLVQAQFAAKTAQLTARSTALTAQISGVASLKSAVTGFSTALANLVKGGTLATQPTSSNAAVLGATALPGAKLTGLSASVVVSRLATGQTTRTTAAVADRAATTLGSGRFTLSIGSKTYVTEDYQEQDPNDPALMVTRQRQVWSGVEGGKTMAFDLTDASLDGVAAAINATRSGVTASVVTDAKGQAYLSMKGQTGTEQAFMLTASDSSSDALKAVSVGPGAGGTVVSTDARNAALSVDGIPVERAGNMIDDLVAGVRLNLTGVSTTPVTLGSTTPTTALTQAVDDVVATYNEVLAIITEQTDPITGNLRADPAAKALLRALKALTLTPLNAGGATGAPRTLAEIGVTTTRDGTLKLDADALARAMAANPDAIEAMFAPSSSTGTSLSGVLNSLSLNAGSTVFGLGASATRYAAAQSDLGEAKDKIADQSDQLTTRLTKQFASMNARVSAYKSTQTFLTNQIAAWNKDS